MAVLHPAEAQEIFKRRAKEVTERYGVVYFKLEELRMRPCSCKPNHARCFRCQTVAYEEERLQAIINRANSW